MPPKKNSSAKQTTTRRPKSSQLSDAEFRVQCNEIANILSQNWRFKWQVIGLIAIAVIVITSVIASITGVGINSELKKFKEKSNSELASATEQIKNQITEEFKKENIKKTVETVASKESARLLESSVEPGIKAFQEKIDSVGKDIEGRFSIFDGIVKKREEEVASSLEAFRVALSRLQSRNEITALADLAIAKGDVEAYRKLDLLTKTEQAEEKGNAATSELFRVIQAYSIFAPNRSNSVKIVASAVNSRKNTEEELDAEELLNLLAAMEEPIGRAKIAQLLKTKVKQGSYTTALALVEALRRETHLEAFHFLGQTFQFVTKHDEGGSPDRREDLKWWEENKERLKKEDADINSSELTSPK